MSLTNLKTLRCLTGLDPVSFSKITQKRKLPGQARHDSKISLYYLKGLNAKLFFYF
jgi:hypothetical protein